MLYDLFLMTGATLIMRFVGMAFSVYITNKIGAAGMGLYSLVMSVGGFAVTVALSGVNLASTRMTAAAIGRGSEREVRGAMRRCILYGIVFGLAAMLGLLLLAKPISVYLLHDKRCISLLRVLSIGLPFMSLTSALGGYFAAVRRVVKSAIASFFEQFVKIAVCVWLIGMIAPKGVEYACLAVILGGSISEVASFLLSVALYIGDRKKHTFGAKEAIPSLTRKMLDITLPVALSAYVRSGLLTVEHLLIPIGLRHYGTSYDAALASYGTLQGMALPVILFPQALVGALSGLLVPELSERQARMEYGSIENTVSRGIQFTLCFSVGAAGMMSCFSQILGQAVYHSSEAGKMIGMLAPLIPIMYLDHIVDGMLKGLGEQLYSMRVNIADAFLSVILVWVLIPRMGISGYILTIFLMEVLNASLSIMRLLKVCDIKVRFIKWVLKPLASIAAASSVVALIMSRVPQDGLSQGIEVTLEMTLVFVLYCMFLRLCRAIDTEDMEWLKRAVK